MTATAPGTFALTQVPFPKGYLDASDRAQLGLFGPRKMLSAKTPRCSFAAIPAMGSMPNQYVAGVSAGTPLLWSSDQDEVLSLDLSAVLEGNEALVAAYPQVVATPSGVPGATTLVRAATCAGATCHLFIAPSGSPPVAGASYAVTVHLSTRLRPLLLISLQTITCPA